MMEERRSELVQKIKEFIARDDSKIREEFYRVARDGAIPIAEAIRLWNGKDPADATDETLSVLCRLFSQFYPMKSFEYYFFNRDDIREQFMNLQTKAEKAAYRSLFGRMSRDGEKAIGKPVCEMNADEIGAAMSCMRFSNQVTAQRNLNRLAVYFKWCEEHGYSVRAYDAIRKHGVSSILSGIQIGKRVESNMLADTDELEDILTTAYDSSRNTTGFVLSILAWIGFDKNEALKIESDDVSFTDSSVIIKNEAYRLPVALLKMLSDYKQIDVIYADRLTFYTPKSKYYIKPYILTNDRSKVEKYTDTQITPGHAATLVMDVGKEYRESTGENKDLNYTSIVKSGVFHRMLLAEQNGVELTNEVIMEMCKVKSVASAYNKRKEFKLYKEIFS